MSTRSAPSHLLLTGRLPLPCVTVATGSKGLSAPFAHFDRTELETLNQSRYNTQTNRWRREGTAVSASLGATGTQLKTAPRSLPLSSPPFSPSHPFLCVCALSLSSSASPHAGTSLIPPPQLPTSKVHLVQRRGTNAIVSGGSLDIISLTQITCRVAGRRQHSSVQRSVIRRANGKRAHRDTGVDQRGAGQVVRALQFACSLSIGLRQLLALAGVDDKRACTARVGIATVIYCCSLDGAQGLTISGS